MQFYEKLKKLRTERGLTQKELAEKLNVSRSAVAKWENGLGLPSEQSLGDLAAFFGVSRESLLSDRETESVVVSKNGQLSVQKGWLIVVITVCAVLFILTATFLGLLLMLKNLPPPYTHEHDFTEVVVLREATCEEQGQIKIGCECGTWRYESTSKAEHDWGEWHTTIEPSCKAGGTQERVCRVNEYHREYERLEPLGHEWGEWITETEPKCTTYGVQVRTCMRNGEHTETEYLDSVGHDWGEWEVEIKPTCMESGSEVRHCKREWGADHSEKRTVDPVGNGQHAFGAWETVRKATCYMPGEEERVCTVCGVAETQGLPIAEHTYGQGWCAVCGRRDWMIADMTDPDLYNSEAAYRALGELDGGVRLQMLYYKIDRAAREYHAGAGNSAVLGEFPFTIYDLTQEEALVAWKAYYDDHPLYYWLDEETVITQETITVRVDEAYCNSEVRAALNGKIYETVRLWRADAEERAFFNGKLNAYLAALCYHDAVIFETDFVYQSNGYTPESAHWAQSIAGVFEGRGAVYAGYARTFSLLLNASGIENYLVSGTVSGKPRIWNLARLDDGGWYSFDLAEDDTPNRMWGVRYNFFAVTDLQDIAWMDAGYITTPKAFADHHILENGTGSAYLPELPSRAQTPYAGTGEMLLRETFTVGNSTYAVVGLCTVQLIYCVASGDVTVPESVEYDGVEYEVISVGSMNERGLFEDSGCAFQGSIGTLTFPASIRFLWTSACNSYPKVEAFAVAEDNAYFTAVDGVLFTKGMFTLIAYPEGSSRTEYAIPDEVRYLAYMAFEPTPALRSLRIGKNLCGAGTVNWGWGWQNGEDLRGGYSVVLGEWGTIFRYLSNLECVEVDEENEYYSFRDGMLFNKAQTVLYAAFYSFEELRVPSSVERVDYHAFFSYYNLRRVVFEGTALIKIESAAFSACHNLDEFVYAGTRDQWYALVDRSGEFDSMTGSWTPDETYTVTCLGDEE